MLRSLHAHLFYISDINKIADKIAHVNQVNIKKIQLNLIEKWFRSTSAAKQDDLDVVSTCQRVGGIVFANIKHGPVRIIYDTVRIN